jgi:hypothetical protein
MTVFLFRKEYTLVVNTCKKKSPFSLEPYSLGSKVNPHRSPGGNMKKQRGKAVWIDPELYQSLREIAEKRDKKIGKMVNRIVGQWLQDNSFLPSDLLPSK